MKNIFLMITIVLTASCQGNFNTKSKAPKPELTSNINASHDTSTMESYKTVVNFLKWYRTNYNEVNRGNLVGTTAGKVDSTQFYTVNFTATEAYLRKLSSSTYISNNYIVEWRAYFAKCQENFTAMPQFEGPPDGFDFDLVLYTQEDVFAYIDNPKILELQEQDNSAVVNIDIQTKLSFSLSKVNGRWIIDKIEPLQFD